MRDAFVPLLDPQGVLKRAEIEFVLLKERPNFKPEAFIDDRFLKSALKTLGAETAAR
jgi:hypothetical protein